MRKPRTPAVPGNSTPAPVTGFSAIPLGPKTIELRDRLDQFLSRFDHPGRFEALENFGPLLSEAVQQIRIARRELDARLFLLVVVGPVKSGKSTAVNLLVGRQVSPVSREECTRRPSLIVHARPDEPERIEVFYAGDTTDTDDHAPTFDRILQYLQGLIPLEDLLTSTNVHIERSAFSREKAEQVLAGDDDPAPLMVAIRVHPQHSHGVIVDDHLAIVDMPGIDGQYAGVHKSPFHQWILDHADFILFVQSSVAVLTGQVSGFVAEYWHGKHPSLPVWMFHNIIDGKHWRDDEEIQREERQTSTAAAKELQRLLRRPGLRKFSANLAMAWDALFDDPERFFDPYYSRSGFDAFRTSLRTHISENHARIHERNWVRERVAQRIRRARESLAQVRTAIETCTRRRQQREQHLREAREILRRHAPDIDLFIEELRAFFRFSVKYTNDNEEIIERHVPLFEKWKRTAQNEIAAFVPSARISGADLRKRVNAFIEKIAAAGEEAVQRSSRINALRDGVLRKLHEHQQPLQRKLREILGEDLAIPDPAPLPPDSFDALTLDRPLESPTAEDIREKRRLRRYLWIKKGECWYTADEVEEILHRVLAELELQMRERAEAWKNQVEQILTDYLTRRREAVEAVVNQYEQQLRERFEKEQELDNAAAHAARQIQTDIQKIEEARSIAEGWLDAGTGTGPDSQDRPEQEESP